MIEREKHWERYSALMDRVTGGDAQSARRRDGGYKAALYILAADDDLYRLAAEAADEEGVAFGKIVSRLKKECYSESQLTALLAARGLFSGRDFGVGPMDFVSCEWSVLDVICNGMYLWKGREAMPAEDGGIVVKAGEREGFARRLERKFDMVTMDTAPSPSAHH